MMREWTSCAHVVVVQFELCLCFLSFDVVDILYVYVYIFHHLRRLCILGPDKLPVTN